MPPSETRLPDAQPELRPPPAPRHLPRPIVVVHVLSLAAAFGVWAYLDRHLWFFGDEWDFLTRRGLHGAYFSIWTPHNEHWSVLPILLWRAIYSVEHLTSYWPYLVPLLLAHVAVVHLVWRRCLREGADPWVATALALLFALLGAGAEDLAWAFQIGFVSSVVFGFLAMEVAEGPPGPGEGLFVLPSFRGHAIWRDVAASALAVAALMCSTVGVATGIALGALLLGRFGWRRVVRALAVPVGAFLAWFALAGHSGLKATGDYLSPAVFSKIPTFVASNLAADIGKTAGWASGGPVLALAMLAWVLWRCRGPKGLFRRHPAVLGGVIAAVAFYALAAVGRDRISATMSPSRYAYVGTAFLLPALALILTSLRNLVDRRRSPTVPNRVREVDAGAGGVGRWRYLRLVVVAVVLLATLSNLVAGVRFVRSRTVYVRGLENQIITSGALLQGRAQLAEAVDTYPIWASGFASGYLTPQMLASLYRDRLLPRPSPSLMTPTEILNDKAWLDITDKHHLFHARLRLLSTVGVTWSVVAPGLVGASPTWPTGPGRCEWAVADGRSVDREFTPSLRFGLAQGSSGSLWVSLGKPGGKVLASLAAPWGITGLPGPVALEGQALQVNAGGYIWVNDSAGGEDLVLQLAAGTSAEFCGLAPAPAAAQAAA